jgi:hypothetical protein
MVSTNKILMGYHDELQQMQEQSVLGFILKQRIADFYKQNRDEINSIIKKITKLQHEFFEFEKTQEGEEIKYTEEIHPQPAIEASEGVYNEQEHKWEVEPTEAREAIQGVPAKPVYLEGKTMEMWREAYDKLMNENCNIK